MATLAWSVLAVLVAVSAAHPQSNVPQILGQRQQQTVRQHQATGQQQSVPQGDRQDTSRRIAPAGVNQQQGQRKPPAQTVDFNSLPPNFRFVQLSVEQVHALVSDAATVQLVTDCFVNPTTCKSASALNLRNQIVGLGPGGTCTTCTQEEQKKTEELLYVLVKGLTTYHPDAFVTLTPFLKNIL